MVFKMGNWKLEIFRMCLYISFPVGMFLLFNYPPFYEKTILEGRRKLAASYDVKGAEMLEQFLKERKRKEMEETVEEMKRNPR